VEELRGKGGGPREVSACGVGPAAVRRRFPWAKRSSQILFRYAFSCTGLGDTVLIFQFLVQITAVSISLIL
jgi:hypothetical protein